MPGVNTTHHTPSAETDLDWIADPPAAKRSEPRAHVWWGITTGTTLKVVAALIAAAVIGAGLWAFLPSPSPIHVPADFFAQVDPQPQQFAAEAEVAPDGQARVFVHVAGAVIAPGLVELEATARVAEAIDTAGGAHPDADLSAVNLAETVADGQQIYVPTQEENSPPAGAGGPSEGGVVNLNTADEAALQELPGIGPVLAERIVQFRESNGPFAKVDALQQVPGVGPALMEQIHPLATT